MSPRRRMLRQGSFGPGSGGGSVGPLSPRTPRRTSKGVVPPSLSLKAPKPATVVASLPQRRIPQGVVLKAGVLLSMVCLVYFAARHLDAHGEISMRAGAKRGRDLGADTVATAPADASAGAGTAQEIPPEVVPPAPPVGSAPQGHADPPPEQFLMIGVIPQQFTSALQQGIIRMLKIAAATNRAAVIPQSRFEEPAFRVVLPPARQGPRYFKFSEMLDEAEYFKDFSCVPRVHVDEWNAAANTTVDLFVHLHDLNQACQADRFTKAFAEGRPITTPYADGVPYEDKFLDTLQGRIQVKKVACISQWASQEEFAALVEGHRTVMITNPGFHFLGKGLNVCGQNAAPLYPPVAPQWRALARMFAQQHLGHAPDEPPGYGCIHMRVEKLLRHLILKSNTFEWEALADGSHAAPVLERCLQSAVEMAAMVSERSGGHVFVMHDMDATLGTTSRHYEGKVDINKYDAWVVWAANTLNQKIPGSVPGYCGSRDFDIHMKSGGSVGDILTDNPRTCSLVGAGVCSAARIRMRLGDGSFGAFATHIIPPGKPLEGPTEFAYNQCEAVEAAAAKCKEEGRCRTIPLREP